MAVSLVGTASGGNNNGDDVSINLPGGTSEDDIVLVMGGTAGSGGDAGVNTSGYTELIDRDNVCELSVNWKRMSGSPDSSVSCKGSGVGTDATAYVVMVFRGVSTTTAIDATSTSDESNNNHPNSPSISGLTDGAGVISCFIQSADEAAIDPPAGYGNSIEISRTETNPVTVGAAWDRAVGTSANPGSWDSGTSARWVAATIALRPAVVGTVTDAVLSATGTGTFSPKGDVGSLMRLNATGTGTATWTGQALGIVGALAATGTATVSFEGEGGGLGVFSMTGAGSVSWVGGKEYMSSVREVIESRGAATVTVH
jgi:hypothetical protein